MGFAAGASHLAPGLAVFFVPEVTSATGRDVHLAATRGNGDRDDVPQIFRDDVGNDEVDFLGGICRRAFEFDDVAGAVRVPGGLDLKSTQSASRPARRVAKPQLPHSLPKLPVPASA